MVVDAYWEQSMKEDLRQMQKCIEELKGSNLRLKEELTVVWQAASPNYTRKVIEKRIDELENKVEKDITAKERFCRLVAFCVEKVPDFTKTGVYSAEHVGSEDAEQPFFSEAFLYNLLGKMDARTLQARLNHLGRSLGVDRYDWDRIWDASEREGE